MEGNIAIGEKLNLNDGKAYTCINVIEEDSRRYALLMTDRAPLEICFVEQTGSALRIVGSKEEKEHLRQLFEQNVRM